MSEVFPVAAQHPRSSSERNEVFRQGGCYRGGCEPVSLVDRKGIITFLNDGYASIDRQEGRSRADEPGRYAYRSTAGRPGH